LLTKIGNKTTEKKRTKERGRGGGGAENKEPLNGQEGGRKSRDLVSFLKNTPNKGT